MFSRWPTLVQYADDTTAILKDEASVHNFLSKVELFKSESGLKINTEKTKALWLGEKPPFKLPKNIKWSNKPEKILGIYLSFDLEEANKISFSEKINNIKHLIFSWKHRKLTLNGKIIILKSLALSQLTLLFTVLPTSKEIIQEVEKLFYEFVWDGKTHKVKKRVVIQDFKYGGHKMIDINSYVICQKLKWVKLYFKNHNAMWNRLKENLINVKNLNLLLRSNFSLHNNNLTKSTFYNEVLLTLKEIYKLDKKRNANNIFNQLVFYNELINVNGKMCYDDDFFKAGLWKVSDLFDNDNKLLPFIVWERRGVSQGKYMLWRSVVSTVNSYNILLNTEKDCNNNNVLCFESGDTLDLETCNSRHMYQTLVKVQKETPTCVERYSSIFPDLSDHDISNMFLLARLLCRDIEIQSMQFKILHRYIPTNDLLFKMNKVVSNKCTFCNLYPENILHLFFECLEVRTLLNDLKSKLNNFLNCNLQLKCKDVIIGYRLTNLNANNVKFVNIVLLHAKFFIWQSRCRNILPSYARLKQWLQRRKIFTQELNSFIDSM